MRTIIAIFIISCFLSQSFSQNCNWAQRNGSSLADYGQDITSDDEGNTYSVGSLRGATVTGCSTLTSAGASDIYVQKRDRHGNCIWAFSGGSTGIDGAYGVAYDTAGFVFVTGAFQGTITFPSYTITANAGAGDIFLAKYDTAGNNIWARNLGGSSETFAADYGNRVAVDINGNVLVTSLVLSGGAPFVMGCDTFPIPAAWIVAVSKYDKDGNCQWNKLIRNNNQMFVGDIATDPAGNVFITFTSYGTLTYLDCDTIAASGNVTPQIAKYDANGNCLWGKNLGTANAPVEGRGYGIDSDTSGNIYITGGISGPANISCETNTSTNPAEIFINKRDNNGNCIWAKKIGGSVGADQGLHISIRDSGLFVTGSYATSCAFPTNTLVGSGAFQCGFVSRWDLNGNCKWASEAGKGNQICELNGVASDKYGSVYVTGYALASPIAFQCTTLNALGTYDATCARYAPPCLKPTAQFMADTVCLGSATSFTNISSYGSDPFDNFGWDFTGDSIVDTAVISPGYVFSTTGVHTAMLIAENDCGGIDTLFKQILVHGVPVVSLALNPDTLCSAAATYSLTGGAPSGGIYSGTGVSAGNFAPGIAGAGMHNIYYTYTDGNGCIVTDTAKIVVETCTGINEYAAASIAVYPNPFTDHILVDNKNRSRVHIQVTGIDGKEVSSLGSSHAVIRIDVSGLAKGMYFIHITDAVSGRMIGTYKAIK